MTYRKSLYIMGHAAAVTTLTLTSPPVDSIVAFITSYVMSHEKDAMYKSCQTLLDLPGPPASDLHYELICLK